MSRAASAIASAAAFAVAAAGWGRKTKAASPTRQTRPKAILGTVTSNYLSAYVEYNHYEFGTSRISFTPQVAGLPPAFVDIEETTDNLRVGLNIRFNL